MLNLITTHHLPHQLLCTPLPPTTYHPPREPSGGVDVHNQFIDTKQQRHCVDIKIVCRMLTICALSAANLILCPDSIHTAQGVAFKLNKSVAVTKSGSTFEGALHNYGNITSN